MKRIKLILITAILVLIPRIMLLAQTPPPEPPHPGSDPSGTGGIPVGGTPHAPVGGGEYALVFMAMAYGYYQFKKRGTTDSSKL
ncbi:MAG: hypothetical protein HXX13_00030 [Bacteroidetes bacterium]|nr:hypothetical protein [Bacteroidota bacterium]